MASAIAGGRLLAAGGGDAATTGCGAGVAGTGCGAGAAAAGCGGLAGGRSGSADCGVWTGSAAAAAGAGARAGAGGARVMAPRPAAALAPPRSRRGWWGRLAVPAPRPVARQLRGAQLVRGRRRRRGGFLPLDRLGRGWRWCRLISRTRFGISRRRHERRVRLRVRRRGGRDRLGQWSLGQGRCGHRLGFEVGSLDGAELSGQGRHGGGRLQ